jgi:zinc/manganese transport system permease protein
MLNAWIVASAVAVVAGLVGFFTVLRGSAFAAHAVPNGSFAGAAGAVLIGVNTIVGLGVVSLLGALVGRAWSFFARRSGVVTEPTAA